MVLKALCLNFFKFYFLDATPSLLLLWIMTQVPSVPF